MKPLIAILALATLAYALAVLAFAWGQRTTNWEPEPVTFAGGAG